ncbi:MBL fold metallo-hydrolase [Acetomicrobium sp.]|uniref:MBL fold metallo-hydrolase n=1 Tax=Acetomicrobium sp. TaxID=1872099 RepID=UPI002FCC24C8
MRLKCLGGFGEQGRSALLVEGKSCFLVDYGVKKTVGEGILGELPLEDFPELDFIVVTHAHQDHTAMLPLLVGERYKCAHICHSTYKGIY